MGKWFPKCLLTWREPRVVVRWRIDAELRNWSTQSRLLYVLLVPFVILPPWLIGWELNESKSLPPAVAVPAAFIFGILLVFVMPHTPKILPSFIRIMEHGIAKTNHGTSVWTYDRIESCSLGTKEIETQRVSVLTVMTTRGQEVMFGIDDQVPLERIEDLLREKGVNLGVRV